MKLEETFYGKLYSEGYLPFYAGAISDGSRGILFPGQSGAGKTTTVSFLTKRGFLPMGDEFIVLTEISGKPILLPGEEVFRGSRFNRIRPEINKSELHATVILLPRGDGRIREYEFGEMPPPFIFRTNAMRLHYWKRLTDIIRLFFDRPIYIAYRPTLDHIASFIEKIMEWD